MGTIVADGKFTGWWDLGSIVCQRRWRIFGGETVMSVEAYF